MKKRFIVINILVLLFSWLVPLPAFAQEVTFSVSVADTRATFNGLTAPDALVTFLDNGQVVGTANANSAGSFTKTLTNQTAGSHSFGIYAQDSSGKTTLQYSFVISLINQTETIISNIVLPATIELEKESYFVGEQINITGYAAPNVTITVFVYSQLTTETTQSGADGKWSLDFKKDLEVGTHTTYTKATTAGGLQSTSSEVLEFLVTEAPVAEAVITTETTITETIETTPSIPAVTTTINPLAIKGDANGDGKINLTDFSILLYDWENLASRSDLNKDGLVDVYDFSIMMYNWTG